MNAGGVGYSDDDILTAVGGTFIRPATFRADDTAGVVQSVELVDPGDYSVAPSPLTANLVTGGGGINCSLDLTVAVAEPYQMLLARLVTALNAQADIAGASLDLSEALMGARLLTLSDATDALGDATVELEIRQNGVAYAALVGTITDGGSTGDVLSAAIPASPVPYPLAVSLKGVG